MDFFSLLQLKGFPVSEARKLFSEIPAGENILEWQEEKRWEIFRYHKESNSHYNSLIKKAPEIWSDIPILSKEDLRLQPNEYKYNHARKLYIRNTSGSTGKPLTYSLDYLSHTMTWLLVAKRYMSVGVSLKDYQARMFGIPLSWRERTVELLKDNLANRFRFNVLDLSDRALEKWIERFKTKRFKYIYGYSFPIISFAKFLKSREVVLKEVCPTLKTAIVTSEMCSAEDEQTIKEAFGVPVTNEYGASEIGIIGFGKTGNWRISDELISVEIVNDDGNLLPDGEVGRVICTPLFNHGTPFIRYEIGDLASIELINGIRTITNLVGRQEELAILPSGKKAPGDTVFYYVFKEFSSISNKIKEYRTIQKSLSEFEIQIVTNSQLSIKEESLLKRTVEQYLEQDLTINIKRVDNIERTKMGKYRRFISETNG